MMPAGSSVSTKVVGVVSGFIGSPHHREEAATFAVVGIS